MKRLLKNTITVVCLMVFFIACKDEYHREDQKRYEGKCPDESAEDIELIFSENGTKSFVVFTPLLNTYSGDNAYSDCPKGVIVTSFDNNGEKQSVLTADYAIKEEGTMKMEARNHVVITDLQKNETIETEQIIWDQRKKTIFSVVPVKQTKADGTVNYGDGFEADERFSKYKVLNPRGEVLTNDL